MSISANHKLGLGRAVHNGIVVNPIGIITAEDGSEYQVNFPSVIENFAQKHDLKAKMPDNRPVLFVPHPWGNDDGQIVHPWADEVYLLPCETRQSKQELGLDVEKVKVISVFILLRAKGDGHIYNAPFVSAKFRFLALGTMKVAELLGGVKKRLPEHVHDIRGDVRYTEVPYEEIAPDVENPMQIDKPGMYYKGLGLPWHQIGAVGLSNPGVKISMDQTIDESGVKESGVIYCEAWRVGNGLTSYGVDKSSTVLNLIGLGLDIIA
jgi:hypothetical protein